MMMTCSFLHSVIMTMIFMIMIVIADYSDLHISPVSGNDNADDDGDDGFDDDYANDLHIPPVSDGTDAENKESRGKELVSNPTW